MGKEITRAEMINVAYAAYDDFLDMRVNIYAIYGEGKYKQFICLNRESKMISVISEGDIFKLISRSFDILNFSYDYRDLREVFLRWRKTLPKLEDVICKEER